MPVPSSWLHLGQLSPIISEEVLQPLCTLLELVQRMALGHAGPLGVIYAKENILVQEYS